MNKKQHFVPQMFLKNFCIADEPGKCWEYNLHNKAFSKKRTEELCVQNYLYEIRDDNGNYYYENGKNAVEKGFCQLESQYVPFIDVLLTRLEDGNRIVFTDNDLELLYAWISFLMIRNPLLLQAIPYVAKEIGTCIDTKIGKSYNFIELMPFLMEKFSFDLKKGHIEFLKSDENCSFVISDIPVIVKGNPLHHFCYVPISSKFAIVIQKPETIVTDVHSCIIRKLKKKDVMHYNYMIFNALINSFESELSFGNSLIANNQSILMEMILPGV
ncbi:DUF4238 domain-containing protein [Ruminococcus sp.]|uniref:DUF4238 domain-containing protein n=1 Tax=Ruminococcus sp. TaxID=41978 RepID=UPI0025E1B236|nr:DUF4238 domain-containing protein [Ruminococcus sp.]